MNTAVKLPEFQSLADHSQLAPARPFNKILIGKHGCSINA